MFFGIRLAYGSWKNMYTIISIISISVSSSDELEKESGSDRAKNPH